MAASLLRQISGSKAAGNIYLHIFFYKAFPAKILPKLAACTAAAASANEVAYLLKRAQKSPMPHRFGLFCTLHSKLIYLVYRVCPNVTLSFVHNAL